jgi:hypothetical protein
MYIFMVAIMKDSTCLVQPQKKTSSEALKYSWLSIQIRDPMMQGRSGISRTWNLQETPWTQEPKKNMKKKMKIPRKKEKPE